MRRAFVSVCLVISWFAVSIPLYGQYCEEEYDVPYVPTKHLVVEEMLKMANVTSADILYDLGCGDGRIVITAAKKYGVRGVGIDINPERISESEENAAKEGVTDNVRFIEQNLFDADIREATVVTLYLLPSLNLKLRPLLFEQLRPGTRIVSHDFDMGDWEPDQTKKLENSSDFQYGYDNHTVYFWTLPANVSGTWKWKPMENENEIRSLNLEQEYQIVTGTLSTGNNSITVADIELTGDNLKFTAEIVAGGKKRTETYDGVVNGNTVTGTMTVKGGTNPVKKIWKADRDISTMKPWNIPTYE